MPSLPPDLRALRRDIESHPALRRVWQQVAARPADAAHDTGHLLRVAWWAAKLAPGEQRVVAIAAGLAHDLVQAAKNAPGRAESAQRSADAAAVMLSEAGFGDDAVEAICTAIAEHSFSRGAAPSTPLSAALQDADRLDALGAIGIWRAVATGASIGALLFDPSDPFGEERPRDDGRFTLDHFYTKLLHLAERMNTEVGRAEARRRVRVVREHLAQLAGELGVDQTPS